MLAVLLGVYAIAQMIGRINKTEAAVVSNLKAADKDDHITKEDVKKTLPIMTKSSLIGAFIGAVPGTGGAIASFIAYNEAKRKAKPGEKFGEGEIKATAATLIPLLTLGIPGDVVAATLLGAFTMHGLVVGPKLFETSGPIVYAVLIGCVIAQLIMFFQGKYLLGLFVKITHIPQELLTALLVVICCAGAFAIGSSEIAVWSYCILYAETGLPIRTDRSWNGTWTDRRVQSAQCTGNVKRFLDNFCKKTYLSCIYYLNICAHRSFEKRGCKAEKSYRQIYERRTGRIE